MINLHSARTRSLSLTKSGNVSFVREATSDADATAASPRPKATAEKVRMLSWFKGRGGTEVKALGGLLVKMKQMIENIVNNRVREKRTGSQYLQ
jgi:hypothetical protein